MQYLKNGCTQYFTNKTTEQKLNNAQKSSSHANKGGLKDPMLDDVEDFNNMDKVYNNILCLIYFNLYKFLIWNT